MIRKLFIAVSILFSFVAQAQEENAQTPQNTSEQELSLENGKQYQIGGISVTGTKRYNAQTILTAANINVGDTITIPSEKFSRIIHKLWGYKLFNDIDIYITRTEGDKVFLELAISETHSLTEALVTGVKKKKSEEIIKDADLKKGAKVNESLIAKTKDYITNKYKKEGYLNTKVHIATKEDTTDANGVKMLINIDKGNKVKINEIAFEGNEKYNDAKLRKQLKNTKQRFFGRFWKRSKYVKNKFNEDLASLVDFYKENGYRDARVVSDTLFNDNNDISLKIKVEEGNKYYFGNIKFLGNSVYNNQTLNRMEKFIMEYNFVTELITLKTQMAIQLQIYTKIQDIYFQIFLR